MGVSEMASMLTQHALSNECNDNDQMLQPQPDQTDTIDGEFLPFIKRLPTFHLYSCVNF